VSHFANCTSVKPFFLKGEAGVVVAICQMLTLQ
jgi:hypothetical protein